MKMKDMMTLEQGTLKLSKIFDTTGVMTKLTCHTYMCMGYRGILTLFTMSVYLILIIIKLSWFRSIEGRHRYRLSSTKLAGELASLKTSDNALPCV